MQATVDIRTAPNLPSLKALIKVFDAIRVLEDDMQAQTVLILLHIARKPHLQMKDLEEATGLASSSISRNVAALGKVHRKGKAGLDLVTAYEDPEDRRFKRVHLTPKGRKFIDTLNGFLGE